MKEAIHEESRALELLDAYLRRKGLNNTVQRRLVASVFFRQRGHLSCEELYALVRATYPGLGQTTVYRALKLFCDAGLARPLYFGDGHTRYESSLGGLRHAHLICTHCGRQSDVPDAAGERLNDELARRNGFLLTEEHRYLYGICPSCRKQAVCAGGFQDTGLEAALN